MSDFTERPAPGTRVHVEFDGVVDDSITLGREWAVAVFDHPDNGLGRLHYVNWESDTVTKLADPAPENWPPQLGDVWNLRDQPSEQYHVLQNEGEKRLYFYTPFGAYKYAIGEPGIWELAYRPDVIL